MSWFDRLRMLKKESGMTIQQVADLSGVPLSTLNKLFAGRTEDPKLDTIRSVVHAMGYTLNDLEDNVEAKESPGTAEAIPGDQDEAVIMNFVGELSEDQQELLIVLLQKMIEQNQRKLSSHPEEADAPGKE